jgi:Deacetylase PdaC/Protein of unknown function (DUF3298)
MRTRLVALLIVVACNKNTDATPTIDASTTTTAASVSAPTTPSSKPTASASPAVEKVDSKFTVYVGTVGKDRAALGLERRGDSVHAAFIQGYAEPIDLDGTAKSDGTVTLKERGFLTRKGNSISFTIDPKGKLTGTLTDPKSKTAAKLAMSEGSPFTDKDDTFEKSYEGSLGTSTRVRAKWKRDKHIVSGVYRYARSKEDLKLDGTVIASTGAFELTEKNAKGVVTGKWQGIFTSPTVVVARWTSPDGTKTYPLSLTMTQDYPESVTLPGGGKIVPQEDYSERGKACRSSVVFPSFDGLSNRTAQTALNAKLRTFSGVGVPLKAEDCDGAEEALPYDMDSQYVVGVKRPTYVGIDISHYTFTGGAHGMYGFSCYVADLTSGRLIELNKELSPGSLATLTKLTQDQLKKDNSTTTLTDVGFFDDNPEVTADTNVCVREEKGVLTLEVGFQPYEVAPWAMGAPTVEIPAATALPLFGAGSMGAQIFK